MIKKLAIGALALGLFVGLTGGTAYVAYAQADAIKARKDNRQQMRMAAGAIKKVIDDKGNAADVAPHAAKMVELSKQFVTLFPPGSDQGDTKAGPQIWSDRPGFLAANAVVEKAAQDMADAAKTGDMAKVAAAFGAAGKGCADCHNGYQKK